MFTIIIDIYYFFFTFLVVYFSFINKERKIGIRKISDVLFPLLVMLSPLLLKFVTNSENIYELTCFSFILMSIGFAISTWGILVLRKRFSIFIEAVELSKDGPYRYIRHPIYLGELLVIFAQVLQINSIFGYIFFVIIVFLTIIRAKMEEKKLIEAFPNEKSYFERRSRFFKKNS